MTGITTIGGETMTRILIATAVLLAVSTGAGMAAEPQSSDTCGECHRDIFRMWRASAHAEATDDPFFFQSYKDVVRDGPARLGKVCLDCHAPLAVATGDLALSKSVSREGVNCEFCHGLVAVDMTEKGPRHRLDIGSVKRGTIAAADSPAHGVAFSELHRDSRLCAPCHEYVNEDGVSILTTYSEWKESSAAEQGQTCQSCHMAITEGEVVDPKLVRDSDAQVNLHEMPGGHSIHQLLDALAIKVRPKRSGDSLTVAVEVTNRGAGHAVPTGMPGRRIVLSVEVRGGGRLSFEESRVYGKSFKNEREVTIDRVGEYFRPGVLLEADTRIAADESRRETFNFPVPAAESVYLTVSMVYEHAPLGEGEEMERLTFFKDRKLIRRS
jgi:nitrate/TMAO reductase-like tetraheme cytochrome c subunit